MTDSFTEAEQIEAVHRWIEQRLPRLCSAFRAGGKYPASGLSVQSIVERGAAEEAALNGCVTNWLERQLAASLMLSEDCVPARVVSRYSFAEACRRWLTEETQVSS